MNIRHLILCFVIGMTALVTSCDPARVFDETVAIEGPGWHRDSVFHYHVEVVDTLQLHNFFISMRNNTDYPYSNIYIFLTTTFPNGHSTTDTIECILAGRDGHWLGNGSGRIKDNLIMLQPNLRFPIAGDYHFSLEQAMRDTVLVGIEDVGLRIERAR